MSEEASKFLIQVHERRSDGKLHLISTVEVMSGGFCQCRGNAQMAFGPLYEAAKAVTKGLVAQGITEVLARLQEAKAEVVEIETAMPEGGEEKR